jgi:hypothetical protein
MALQSSTSIGVICIAPHWLPLTARLFPSLSTWVIASIRGPQLNLLFVFSRAMVLIEQSVIIVVKRVTLAILLKYIDVNVSEVLVLAIRRLAHLLFLVGVSLSEK